MSHPPYRLGSHAKIRRALQTGATEGLRAWLMTECTLRTRAPEAAAANSRASPHYLPQDRTKLDDDAACKHVTSMATLRRAPHLLARRTALEHAKRRLWQDASDPKERARAAAVSHWESAGASPSPRVRQAATVAAVAADFHLQTAEQFYAFFAQEL